MFESFTDQIFLDKFEISKLVSKVPPMQGRADCNGGQGGWGGRGGGEHGVEGREDGEEQEQQDVPRQVSGPSDQDQQAQADQTQEAKLEGSTQKQGTGMRMQDDGQDAQEEVKS